MLITSLCDFLAQLSYVVFKISDLDLLGHYGPSSAIPGCLGHAINNRSKVESPVNSAADLAAMVDGVSVDEPAGTGVGVVARSAPNPSVNLVL